MLSPGRATFALIGFDEFSARQSTEELGALQSEALEPRDSIFAATSKAHATPQQGELVQSFCCPEGD